MEPVRFSDIRCPKCGYWYYNFQQAVCPECGYERYLTNQDQARNELGGGGGE